LSYNKKMDPSTWNRILILSIVLAVIGIILCIVYTVMKKNHDKDSTKKIPPRALNITGAVMVFIGAIMMMSYAANTYLDTKPKSPFAVHMMSRHNHY
jgi:heme/copper-type cytochrome/quinol oxidase subunit 2